MNGDVLELVQEDESRFDVVNSAVMSVVVPHIPWVNCSWSYQIELCGGLAIVDSFSFRLCTSLYTLLKL